MTKSVATTQQKRLRFVEEYLVDLNATQAAIRAGYSVKTAYAQGSRLLKDAEIQSAITAGRERLSQATGVTAERVVAELAKLAFANMGDFVSLTAGGDPIIDLSGVSRDQFAALSEVTVEDFTDGRGDDAREVRRVKVKLGNKHGALVDLGKHLGLFREAAPGVSVNVNVAMGLAEFYGEPGPSQIEGEPE